ncbi:hypothetical protein L1987_40339 [Smallanthus sonchifolius]|uniref:Uncharacterized protein n=1 Tax=Smallanthus sonchifolius TaxID=185202 RepID=A0ACB9GST2_9ASTR|nr:hypothetical protein L1987_40339 [Smallanthus sonchifolius]
MDSQLQRFIFKAQGSSSVDVAEKLIRSNFGLQQIRLSAADLFFSRRTRTGTEMAGTGAEWIMGTSSLVRMTLGAGGDEVVDSCTKYEASLVSVESEQVESDFDE